MKKQPVVKKLNKPIRLSLSKPVLSGALLLSIILLLVALQEQYSIFFPEPAAMPTPTFETVEIDHPTTAITHTPEPSMQSFISQDLGISFEYDLHGNAGQPLSTKEIGNKVYLYPASHEYTGSDESYFTKNTNFHIEVLYKDPHTSLTDAIQKKFLQGYSAQDCYVEDASKNMPVAHYQPHYQFARITVPLPSGNENSAVYEAIMSSKCPRPYTDVRNGEYYFLADPSHPTKYVFVAVGQSNVLAGDATHSWDETIRFLDGQ